MHLRVAACLAFALAAIAVAPVAAANPPANDNMATAKVIHDLPFTTTRSNELATTEPNEILGECHGDVETHTVWYRYTPIIGSTVRISLTSDFDAVATLFVNDPPQFNGCSDVGGPEATEYFALDMDPGIDFWIRVASKDDVFGNYTLSVVTSWPVPVAHDNFSDSGLVTTLPYTAKGNTTYASTETGEPLICGLPADKTVWFRYDAQARAKRVATTFTSDYDTVLGVFTGTSMADLTAVGCNDDSGMGLHSKVKFKTQPGTTYWFVVGGKNGSAGNYRFRLK